VWAARRGGVLQTAVPEMDIASDLIDYGHDFYDKKQISLK